jgi:hypothetical protein
MMRGERVSGRARVCGGYVAVYGVCEAVCRLGRALGICATVVGKLFPQQRGKEAKGG